MIPPRKVFETVKVDEWINGEISEITYDMKHAFKKTEGPAVRIKISLVGYKYPKMTPWMLFSYSKKSNLFILFVEPLIEGAYEYMNFDLDQIKGMKIKLMFEQKDQYQNIVRVRPLAEKIKPDAVPMSQAKEPDYAETLEDPNVEEIPF